MIVKNLGVPIKSITIDLTKNCNLRCSYCFTKINEVNFQLPKIEKTMLFKIIDWFFDDEVSGSPDNLPLEINFWGGESLLAWDLILETIQYAEAKAKKTQKIVKFNGTTNGTLLTPEKFDFLFKNQIYLLVSLDGIEETHNTNRKYINGKGTFQDIMQNLFYILERFPQQPVRISLTREIAQNFFDIIFRLHTEYKINVFHYSVVVEEEWTEADFIKFEQELQKLFLYYITQKELNPNFYIHNFETLLSRENAQIIYPCGAGTSYLAITCDGSIYPCHRFNKFNDFRTWEEKETCIGHVEYGFKDNHFSKLFINSNNHIPDKCKNCSVYPKCKIGCYAINYDTNQDIYSPNSVFCTVRQIEDKVIRKFSVENKYNSLQTITKEIIEIFEYVKNKLSNEEV